MSKVYD